MGTASPGQKLPVSGVLIPWFPLKQLSFPEPSSPTQCKDPGMRQQGRESGIFLSQADGHLMALTVTCFV